MIRAGIGARVSGDNRKNLSGGIGQSEDTGFVPIVRLVGHSGEYGNAAKLVGKMSKSVMRLMSIHF